jgi:hypothetical protein
MEDLMEINKKEEDVEKKYLVVHSNEYWRDITFLIVDSSPL